MTELNWDPVAIATLESDLVMTKQATNAGTFFPTHAFARGGIGILVSTGSARAGLKRLPKTATTCKALARSMPPGNNLLSASRPSTCPTSRSNQRHSGSIDIAGLASAAAASAVLGAAVGVPDIAKHEWERVVPHPCNFVSTTRQTRVSDVRPASKWATMSLYETDPQEVKRHLDIVDIMDQARVQESKVERSDENLRHFTWAVQQRETFRRQRQEASERYARSGLPVRKAYSARPSTGSYASSTFSDGLGDQNAALSTASWSRGSRGSLTDISLPKRTYVNVYQRMASEVDEALESTIQISRKRAEAAARKKEADELKGTLAGLDSFENHVAMVTRQRSHHGHEHAAHQSHEHAFLDEE